jgi:hypothetical protein
MTPKAERQAARQAVAAYHEARLAELVERAGEGIDKFRSGELDAFETDRVLFQFNGASKELWKFCSLSDVELAAVTIASGAPVDWWERGAPRRR